MIQLKSLLDRTDLVGGTIRTYVSHEGWFSNKILQIRITRNGLIIFVSRQTKRQQMINGKHVWIKTKFRHHAYPATTEISLNSHRPSFNIKNGWVMIFPKDDAMNSSTHQ